MLSIGIDIGGTRIKTGLLKGNKVVASSILDVTDSSSLSGELPQIETAINDMVNDYTGSGKNTHIHQKITGVGIALPSIVDSDNHRILSEYVKYSDAAGIDFGSWIRDTWDTTFIMENDARAALTGEVQFGSCRGAKHAVLLSIGTGIGSAVWIDGFLLKGRNYLAGNLGGHMCIDYRGSICNCGDKGCAETIGSSWALPGRAESFPGILTGEVNEINNIDFEMLFREARKDNRAAIELVNDCLAGWSAILKNMIYAYDPAIIVLSGGVLGSADRMIPWLQKEINALSWLKDPVKLVIAHHPNWAGVMGAAWLAQQAATAE